jgi:RNA polymerase sigma factor (sigma-70 family)
MSTPETAPPSNPALSKGGDERADELQLVEAALSGDESAAAEIRSQERNNYLETILRRRGASPTEAQDIVADVWADCFDSNKNRGSLLERYNGKGPLEGFLTRTALNRLIDYKRRGKFRGELPQQATRETGQPADAFDSLPGGDEDGLAPDDALVKLLRDALVHAFAHCDPEKLAILRLVNVYGIDQATVGRMWGWSQSKISRALSALMEEVRDATLAEVHRADPWLELHWEDFIALCRQSNDIFAGE